VSSRFTERKEFIRICHRALQMGLQVSTGGNLSMRLQDSLFLVKPSGIALFDLREEDLLVTDVSGKPLEGGGKPTKEINTHLGIYSIRPDVRGVVHYHPPYSTTYAVCRKEIPLKTVHARRILGKIPVVPPAPEGSEALAESIQSVFGDKSVHAALLFDHGVIAAGSSLTKAQNLAELVEESARIAYMSYLLSLSV
jgi:L-ribulose-5-phosphate 4-epimerase